MNITNTPLFGLILCLTTYEIGFYISKKTNFPIFNPIVIANILCLGILYIFKIPYEDFNNGASVISLFLTPATAALAISIYKSIDILKKNLIPVLVGCTVGSVASIGSVVFMCKLFKLDEAITASLIPKSVTVPIAMGISESTGGIASVTVAAVVVTGIIGAVSAPFLLKLFRSKSPVEAGIAIGACSHALGTSKAIEISEAHGAMSSIAIGVCGFVTVIFSALLM